MFICICRLMTPQEVLEEAYINLKKERLLVSRGESLTSKRIMKVKQINHDNHPDESKTSTQQIQ